MYRPSVNLFYLAPRKLQDGYWQNPILLAALASIIPSFILI